MDKINIKRRYDKKGEAIGASIILKRDGDKEFIITFGGNLDLYFTLNNFLEDPTFYIGIDNYELYKIFDTLYKDVMSGNVLSDEEDNDLFTLFDEEESLEEKIKRNEEYQRRALDLAHRTGLITDDTIVWISDDYPHDVAPYFKIERLDNAYKISFLLPPKPRNLRGEERYIFSDYEDGYVSIRLRNDGSTYQIFNVPFMKVFNSLLEMELDNPQIHMAEYLLDKELEKGTSLESILTLKKRQ